MATFKIEFSNNSGWTLTINGDSSEGDMQTACEVINFFTRKLKPLDDDSMETLEHAREINQSTAQIIKLTEEAMDLVNEAKAKIKGNTNVIDDDDSDLLPGEKVLKRFDLSDDATEAEE